MRNFSWSKNFFSNIYTISENGEKLGHITGNNLFSTSTDAKLLEHEYKFVSESWHNQNTKVYKTGQFDSIAKINFNNFRSKAEIIYNNEVYILKFFDIWQTRWQISKNDKCVLKSKKSSLSGGKAEIDNDLSELLLIALYASNYFYTIGFLLVIIVIVLVISN